jgi:EmrB/QacA subfamily drug resistance transporter
MAVTPSVREDDTRLTPALVKLALAVIVGTFTVQMDATMVNVALETMRSGFHTSVATIQWVSTAYLLAMAVAVPLAGWGADRFGSKRLWMLALAAFFVGSVAGGLAWSAPSLIASRVLQGLAGGILLPLSQAILAQAAGPDRLGRLMGLVGIPSLLGPIIGPIVGGVLVQFWGWPWIFFLNIPICALAVVLSWRLMPNGGAHRRTRFDLLGFLLLAPGLAGIVYALSEAGNRGGFEDVWVLMPLIVGSALIVAFLVHAATTRHEPLIDIRVFRSRSFASASGLLFFVIIGLMGAMLLVPLYFQLARGDSALQAGLLLSPQGLGAALGIAVCSSLVDRMRAAPIALAGVILAAAGLASLTSLGPNTNGWSIAVALFVLGLGFGAVMVPATALAYRGLDTASIPRATSALRIVQQLGASFGVAILALTLQKALTFHAHLVDAAGNPSDIATAFGHTLWWAFGLTACAIVPAAVLMLRSGRPPTSTSQQAP